MLTELEDAIIRAYKEARSRLNNSMKEEKIREEILHDFFVTVKTILEKRGVS